MKHVFGFVWLVMLSLATLFASSAEARGVVVTLKPDANYAPGTIVIRASKRVLYYVLGDGRAIRYPVAVPKPGKEWFGNAYVVNKFLRPAWAAPEDVRRDHPEVPPYIAGGAPDNPMGAAAIMLDRHEIAIHGSSQKLRRSIGTAASYGCIRMYNEDVQDLFMRVGYGTPVIMKK